MRYVEFTIPGTIPFIDVLVRVTEQDDGSLLFELTSGGSTLERVLRAFFFDIDTSETLMVSGDNVTESDFDVISLGQGADLRGNGRDPYDVGVEFGTPGYGEDQIESTSFTLASTDGTTLTLDMLSYMEVGARLNTGFNGKDTQKLTATVPAAPDAMDDTAETPEDVPVVIDVVANDEDEDVGDELSPTEVSDPANGTVMILDTDNDGDGDVIQYLNDLHWSGTDTFSYWMTDGNGGFDTAEVTVEVVPVADAPNISLTALAGVNAQTVRVQIDSSLVDTDGSETLSSLEIFGIPDGVELLGASPPPPPPDGEPLPPDAPDGIITNPTGTDFIALVLPEGQDFDFDLRVEATATETANMDMATTAETLNVVLDYSEFQRSVQFDTEGRSIWGPGEAFHFNDTRFIGVDPAPGGDSDTILGGTTTWGYNYDIMFGLDSELNIDGGDFEAHVPYDLDFFTSYNETTDVLGIDTAAILTAGGGFMTDGPRADYTLDFVYDVDAGAFLDFFYDPPLLDPLEFNLGDPDLIDVDDTVPIFRYDSETSPPQDIMLFDGLLTVSIAWPELDVAGNGGTDGLYTGSGTSNDALTATIDIDQIITQIFGVKFEYTGEVSVAGLTASATLEVADLNVSAGLAFEQNFMLQTGTLTGLAVFEDGTSQVFTWGEDLVFADASGLDSNGDGNIDLSFEVDLLNSQMANDTDLVFTAGYKLDVLTLDINTPIGDKTLGPLFSPDGAIQLPPSIDVYANTFEVPFDQEMTSLTLIA